MIIWGNNISRKEQKVQRTQRKFCSMCCENTETIVEEAERIESICGRNLEWELNHLEPCLEVNIKIRAQKVPQIILNCTSQVFLRNSQVILMLLVHGPHFE